MMKNSNNFLQYYNQYKDKIYNYFWYRLNFDRDTAEDLTSEVFIKAFSHFDTFEQDGSFQAWIYTIARNHLINYWQRSGREVALDNADGLPAADTIEEKISASLEVKRVMAVISQMDQYDREVLLLKYVDGLSSKEIARTLGKNDGAIRTQLSRAVAQLKEKISI